MQIYSLTFPQDIVYFLPAIFFVILLAISIIVSKILQNKNKKNYSHSYDDESETDDTSSNRYEGLSTAKTFKEKLGEMNEKTEYFYELITEALTAYPDVKITYSKRTQTFKLANQHFAKLVFAGKSLKIYLALDPAAFDEKEYRHKDASSSTVGKHTPLMIKLSSNLAVKRATALIKILVAQRNENSKILK